MIQSVMNIVKILSNLERKINYYIRIKKLSRKYDYLYYVPAEKIISKRIHGFFRLYGVSEGVPDTLLWQSFNSHGESALWNKYGAEFSHIPPYPHLDEIPDAIRSGVI